MLNVLFKKFAKSPVVDWAAGKPEKFLVDRCRYFIHEYTIQNKIL